MRIVGIDPGLATIGIALVEAENPQNITNPEWCAIETKPGLPFPQRLAEIGRDFGELLDEFAPEYAVVEKIFFAVNEKSAIDVAHARGVLLQILATRNIAVLEPTPMQLKHAITGDGNADKRQVQDMLMRMFRLEAPPKPDDAADALALAVYGALQSPVVRLS
jgi:crossover junction endodeoxyribonuclease RuvC